MGEGRRVADGKSRRGIPDHSLPVHIVTDHLELVSLSRTRGGWVELHRRRRRQAETLIDRLTVREVELGEEVRVADVRGLAAP
jgi:hypothetical protein